VGGGDAGRGGSCEEGKKEVSDEKLKSSLCEGETNREHVSEIEILFFLIRVRRGRHLDGEKLF